MHFKDKHQLLEIAVNQSSEPVVITDAQLEEPGPHIIYVNNAFTRLTGYTADEVIGATPRLLQGPATDREMLDRLKEALKAGQYFKAETWNYRKDGTPYRIQWSIAPVCTHDSGQCIDYFVSVQRDVTELYNARQELKSETKRLNAILEAAGDAIITADDQGLIRQFNPAAERMFGYSAEQAVGSPLSIIMPRTDAERHQDYVDKYERTGSAKVIGVGREVEAQRADGSRFPIDLNVNDTGLTNPRLFVGIMHDLTRRKQAEQERLHYYANFDSLTGLPNRRYTLTLIDEAIARAESSNLGVAVFALQLAQLDLVNLGFGEKVGDSLITQTTTSLRNRTGSEPCFIGSSERGRFIVVMEGVEKSAQQLSTIANELIEGIEFDLSGTDAPEIVVRARAGAAAFPADGSTAAALLGQAESALSLSLTKDGPAFHLASPQADARLRERLELEAALYKALERKEFFILYQPQFDMVSGKVIGSEALLRWQHPEKGVVSPADFIPMLEETGLIETVGEWLLNETMEQGLAWSDSDSGEPLHLAINLSARQFHSGRLLQQVQSALVNSGFPVHKLKLEITESLLLDNQTEVLETLNEFEQMGIELALDDFGTGYSSLSYLHSFPLHILKIDQSFVDGIGKSKRLEELLRGIVGLGYALGMNIVAEGIETAEQFDFLRDLGCPQGQGFGLAKPLTASQFSSFLTSSAFSR
ncbi:EAL domain-containing protein [Halorhodospira halochloris]|uniref:EAL domain-containing protein n=1 Tax=Halorhodospira halochloris TaxID=1052 RepID=UPI001EE7AD7E|nr:EAL domain-containing protein [Halorhodospira halochloris]MCG5531383.1 EAL domain-containing protein [Halorhodospira halochloris]